MSNIVTGDEKRTIKIIFPKKKFESYLIKSGHGENKPVFPHFSRLIFGMAYDDFMRGIISLDGFCGIANRLWSHEGKRDDELSNKLLLAAELSYYVRTIKPGDFGQFSSFMAEVSEYCEKIRQ